MSADPIADVREWVGSSPADTEVYAALDRYDGDTNRAALAILRARRADMVSAAAQWAVSGDYSQDATANIKALDAHIGRLERVTGETVATLPRLTSVAIDGPSLGR